MERIFSIGDIHTVTSLRLAGVEGIVADRETVKKVLDEVLHRPDAAVIVITRYLAEEIPGIISDINLNSPKSVIIEIPGIDDPRGFGKSILDYITEALGIAL